MADVRRCVVRVVDADGRTAGAGFLVARGVVLSAAPVTDALAAGGRRPSGRADFDLEIDGVRQDLTAGLSLAFPALHGRRPVPASVTESRDGVAALAPDRGLAGVAVLACADATELTDLVGRPVQLTGFPDGAPDGGTLLAGHVRAVNPDGSLAVRADGHRHVGPAYLGGPVVDRETGLAIGVLTGVATATDQPGEDERDARAVPARMWAALVPDLQLSWLDQATVDADARLRVARRLNVVLAAAVAVLLLAVGFAVAAARSSSRLHDLAVSRLLADRSDAVQATDPLKPLMIAAALSYGHTPEATYAARSLLSRPTFQLIGHRGSVNGLAFGSGGTRLVTAGADGTARFWDLAAHRQVGAALTSSGSLRDVFSSVAISPDGRTMAVGQYSGTIRLYDARSHLALTPPVVDPRRVSVLSLAFSPDGRTLAAAGYDGSIRFLDPATGRPAGAPLADRTFNAVNAVAFSPDGRFLATAVNDGSAQLWNLATRTPVRLSGHDGTVNAVAFSPDGKVLVTGGNDDTLRFWDIARHQQLAAVPTGFGVNGVAFSPDGTRVAAAQGDGAVHVWDAALPHQEVETLTGNTARMIAVAYAPDGRQLAAVGDGGLVKVWDVSAFHQVAEVDLHRPAVSAVGYAQGGRQLIVAQADGTLHFLDGAGHRQLASVQDVSGVNAIALSPDGRTLAVGTPAGSVRFWDVATRRPLGDPLRTTAGGVIGVAYTPDGASIVVVGGNGDVQFWKPADRSYLRGFRTGGAFGAITGLAVAPGGSAVAIAGTEGSVGLFDVQTGQRIGAPFVGQTGALTGVAFSPDGRSLAMAGSDGAVQVWDVASRRELGSPMTAAQDTVNAVAFSPDGRSVLTGGSDGTARIWNVGNVGRSTGLVADLCAQAGRPMTAAEWSRMLPGEKRRSVCPAP